jgi:hypothetical protein
MAIKYAILSGNWSSIATWNGATLPVAGDDVYANGFSVTINQNITVSKISTEVCPPTTIGGGGFFSNANFIYTCDIVGGNSVCLTCNNNSGANLRFIGNIIAKNSTAVSLIAAAYITQVTGNVYGGLTTSAVGIATSNGPQLNNIVGNVISNVGPAYSSSGTNNDTIVGNIYASSTQVGATNNGGFTITGNLFNSGGYMAVRTQRVFINTSNQIQWLVQNQSSTNIQLYSADYFVGSPATSNVRLGVTYGVGGSLTGTLAVPPASSVAVAVPVDNTVGTAIISITDMGALLASYNV